jgi:drug/metabolite transporter (DMT)-like permease
MKTDAGTDTIALLALVAFASNSLLTRLALGSHDIDAATFTALRLIAGAAVLTLIVRIRAGSLAPIRGGGVSGPAALFLYAVPFSFAYLRLGAAVGALVLFGSVQVTMVGYAMIRGERPAALAWLGLALAMCGFAMLTIPSVSRPDPLGIALMAVAGVAWGAYSITGRTASDPIASNARNFLWSMAPALAVALARSASMAATPRGIALALVVGGITSGLGYAVWYRALPRLSVTQASVAQLSVPVLAALGAAGFLGEHLSGAFLASGAAVLGGIALVLVARTRRN